MKPTRLYVRPIGERSAATLVADSGEPPAVGELKGASFFGDNPEEAREMALRYLGELQTMN